jgi:hypothetical protein
MILERKVLRRRPTYTIGTRLSEEDTDQAILNSLNDKNGVHLFCRLESSANKELLSRGDIYFHFQKSPDENVPRKASTEISSNIATNRKRDLGPKLVSVHGCGPERIVQDLEYSSISVPSFFSRTEQRSQHWSSPNSYSHFLESCHRERLSTR